MKQKLSLILWLFILTTAQAQTVTTYAGSSVGGTGIFAAFDNPMGVAFDSGGNLYVANFAGNKIHKITPAGVVTIFAGSGTAGSVDGTGTAATFNSPAHLVFDSSGNLYVADFAGNKIRKITPAGVVTTFAGSGNTGTTDGTGIAASFSSPYGIIFDNSGNLFISDSGSGGNKIRKITPAGVVTTFAGSGTAGSTDAIGVAASFNSPRGLIFDSSGNLFVADSSNNKIRKITSAGVVTTFAGSGTAGSTDASATSATFSNPRGLAFDSSGNLFICDTDNNKIRKISNVLSNQSFSKENFIIYPNPSSNFITIILNNPVITQARIIDMTGKQLITCIINDSNQSIDISNLQKGTYVLQLSNEKGIANQQIIKK